MGADQSTMLLAAWCSVSLSLLSNWKRSKFKWTMLFNERHRVCTVTRLLFIHYSVSCIRSNSDSSQLRWAQLIAPSTLNKHSRLAEVAQMLRNLTARRQSVQKSFDCVDMQNVSGMSVVTGCERYTASSPKLQWALNCCAAVNCPPNTHPTSAFTTTQFRPQIFHLQIESWNLANQIESQIPRTQMKSLTVKSNPLIRLNRDLYRIAIGICPSLSLTCLSIYGIAIVEIILYSARLSYVLPRLFLSSILFSISYPPKVATCSEVSQIWRHVQNLGCPIPL